MTAIAAADGVIKHFGKKAPFVTALDGVSLSVLPGGVTGLVGPDGAGKTTLIRLLAGLMEADGGTLSVLGRPPAEMVDVLGYMPQRFGLYEDLTVIENLTLYARLRKLPQSEWQAVFGRLMEFTDLARFQTRLAGKLSGGMKQKLGLACALVTAPKLLLLDEPGVGVDPISRRELWDMVKALTGEGVGVLWSTAYLDEAEKCDQVYLLNQGRMIYAGPPADLTAEVADRVFRVTGFAARRRKALNEWLDRPEVEDGTLQGRALRLLTRPGRVLTAAPGEVIERAPARLEDGFIDRLGGGPAGHSALAERYRIIPVSDQPAIEAHGLTKVFGDFVAAKDMDFSIPKGKIFGLLGPNGAGKSTTFKMLCGLLTPTSGTGAVAGNDLRKAAADARASLGYMAQKFSLYGELSVRQNLNFFAGAYGMPRADASRAIEAMTEIFQLGDVMNSDAGKLPLGFKQRLALAAAVMHEPPVLFLDEPTSGVDPVARREFWVHINGLVEKGVTVLVTTHFMDEAEYCDDVSLIYRGTQIAKGTPDALKAQAGTLTGTAEPTMEDAFIALIEASDAHADRMAA